MRGGFYSLPNGRLCSFCNGFLRHFSTKASRKYYEVLGVDRKAEQDEIKKAFYTLSKKYHPDVIGASNKMAAEKFMEIKDAYDVLRDEDQRRLYDQQLERRHGGPRSSYGQPLYRRWSNSGDTDGHQQRARRSPSSPEDSQRIRREAKTDSEFRSAPRAGQFYDPTKAMEREDRDKYEFYVICSLFVLVVVGVNAFYIWLSASRRRKGHHRIDK